jgi:hypothetical protein
MKRMTLAAGLSLATLTILLLCRTGLADDAVPFKGSLAGSFTAVPIDPTNPLLLALQLDASGNATHVGNFTYSFPHTVDRSKVPSTGVGTATFTAANGDTLTAAVNGTAVLIGPGLLQGTENGTITGGTGKFANATGSFTISRQINQITLTTVGSFTGSINYSGN